MELVIYVFMTTSENYKAKENSVNEYFALMDGDYKRHQQDSMKQLSTPSLRDHEGVWKQRKKSMRFERKKP